jgi:hypothetical protein
MVFHLIGGMLHRSKSVVLVMVTLPCPRCKDDAHSHSEDSDGLFISSSQRNFRGVVTMPAVLTLFLRTNNLFCI